MTCLSGLTWLLLPLHNPVDVAEQCATLDIITGGRFVLGGGLGYRDVEYAAFGVERKTRTRRLEESIEVIKRLWTEDEVTFEGSQFKLGPANDTAEAASGSSSTDLDRRYGGSGDQAGGAHRRRLDRDFDDDRIDSGRASCLLPRIPE